MRNSSFEVVDHSDTEVNIRDLNAGISITNDAEAVVLTLYQVFGNVRYFYYDTDGKRDELCHDGPKFTGFAVLP